MGDGDAHRIIAALALAELAQPDLVAWWNLLRTVGSPLALFESSSAELRGLGASARAIALLRSAPRAKEAAGHLEHCRRLGMAITWPGRPDYPALLMEISNPPLALFYKGRAPAWARPMLSIVGSRRATRYGTRTAETLAAEAARAGAVVVSGLAAGIDSAAHRGALSVGASVAVGLDPLARWGGERTLYDRLLASGTLLSEQRPGLAPLPRLFPVRNRIITGMSPVTVVIEAARRSDSLVSARLAAEQGREVFAVPGNLDSKVSEGTNRLLADGARPLLETGELLEALGLEPGRAEGAGTVERPDEKLVFGLLGSEPVPLDELTGASGLDGARILELLTALKIGGLAERTANGLFRAALKSFRGRGD